MITSKLHKAAPIRDTPVESVTLVFDTEFPDISGADPDWLQKGQGIHETDAALIEHRLQQALPGGTYDALLRKMLERRAWFFRVSLEQMHS